jgi:hypothetical protein
VIGELEADGPYADRRLASEMRLANGREEGRAGTTH